MKKILNVLLVVMVILSLFVNMCFATEISQENVETTSEEDFQLTEEQLQQLLSNSGYEEEEKTEYFKATVTDSGETVEEDGTIIQNCKVKMKEGDNKDQILDAKAVLGYKDYEESMSASFFKGESVYVTFVEEESEDGTSTVNTTYIVEVNRTNQYITIAILIVIVLLVISLFKGIETIGLIIYNALVITLGIVFMYFKEVNEILSLSTIVGLLIIGDALILIKFKKETLVVMISSLISTIIGFGLMIAINIFFKLQGFVGYFDISALIMIVPAIGITIDVARRSVQKAKDGKDFKSTLKDIFEKMPSKYNMVILVWAAFFIENAVSMQSYLADNEYPFNFMNFGTMAIELSKLAIMILVPVIVVPIAILLANEILKIKKTIGAPSEKEINTPIEK